MTRESSPPETSLYDRLSLHQKLALTGLLFVLGGAVLLATTLWLWASPANSFKRSLASIARPELGAPLVRAIHTSMRPHLPDVAERESIVRWVRRGASRRAFYREVLPLLKRRCFTCHGAKKRPAGASALTDYAQVRPLARFVRVAWIARLRLTQSYLPLLGLGLFLIAFALASTSLRSRWKTFLVLAPFVGLFFLFFSFFVPLPGLFGGLWRTLGLGLICFSSLSAAALVLSELWISPFS